MKMSMDGFDLKLLDALQDNGRLTNHELAERVGLSPSQCSRRRAVLEDTGVIEGYRAQLSSDALGLELTVFVEVSLAAHSPEIARGFAELLNAMDEIQEAYTLTGASDYLIKLVVTDLKRLSAILNGRLLAHPGVARLRSSIVLDHLKQTSRLPIGDVVQA